MRSRDVRFLVSILTVLLAGVLIVAVFVALGDVSEGQEEQMQDVQLLAIQKAVRQCYALEGAYPPNLVYLEDHYGLQLNTDAYLFRYEMLAANIPPIVEVIPHA